MCRDWAAVEGSRNGTENKQLVRREMQQVLSRKAPKREGRDPPHHVQCHLASPSLRGGVRFPSTPWIWMDSVTTLTTGILQNDPRPALDRSQKWSGCLTYGTLTYKYSSVGPNTMWREAQATWGDHVYGQGSTLGSQRTSSTDCYPMSTPSWTCHPIEASCDISPSCHLTATIGKTLLELPS